MEPAEELVQKYSCIPEGFFLISRKIVCDIENFWIIIEDFTLLLWKDLPSKQDNIKHVNILLRFNQYECQ